MAVTVTTSRKSLADVKALTRNVENGWKRVFAGAIKDTMKQVRTVGIKGVTGEVALKARDVRAAFFLDSGFDPLPWGRITASDKRERLEKFGIRPRTPEKQRQLVKTGRTRTGKLRKSAQGVTYKIAKKGARKRLPHAFLIRIGGGNAIGVFERRGKARLPLSRQKRGPSVEAVLKSDHNDTLERMDMKAVDVYPRRVGARLQLLLERS